MSKSKPPYRADHVGSLLRPDSVKRARKRYYDEKSISAEELKAVEDEAIVSIIKMQEDAGLKAVTDGEQRRFFWHFDYMGMLDGLDVMSSRVTPRMNGDVWLGPNAIFAFKREGYS